MLLSDVKPHGKKRGILQNNRTQIYEDLKKRLFNIKDYDKTKILQYIDNILMETEYDEEKDCFKDDENEIIFLSFFVNDVVNEIQLFGDKYLRIKEKWER